MKHWNKLSEDQISVLIKDALQHNQNYFDDQILGIPGSHLDDRVFYHKAPFLKDAPFLNTLIHNPNHIGCHTLGDSEPFFNGTQNIERELIKICAEDIFKGEADAQDGYVASGGTEANIQAVWIYRNFFRQHFNAKNEEIGIVCSTDAHYSFAKASNVLDIPIYTIPVDKESRQINSTELKRLLAEAKKEKGFKYGIVIINMMTTMFGSIDSPTQYAEVLNDLSIEFKMHVDGAYGGFVYPFSVENYDINFENPLINSITLDAHKMLQAPYGTGIFLIRKDYMHYTFTESAKYVSGHDITLVGSRSGANAIAVWMILMTYGPHEWYEKIQTLILRTNWLCRQLDKLNIKYYRNPYSNIVSIYAGQFPQEISEQYGLVPDNHDSPSWYKIVVMEHVTVDKMERFVESCDLVIL